MKFQFKDAAAVVAVVVTVFGMVEWRVRAAAEEPKNVEQRLKELIEDKEAHADQRSEWFRQRHEDLREDVKDTKASVIKNQDFLIQILQSIQQQRED